MMSKQLPIFPDKALKQSFSGRDIPEDSIIQSCVRCGLCLPHCPTYLETLKETSSPRGRIHLMEAVAAGQLGLTDPGFIGQMYQCLDCRACEAVCPSGVQYGKLVEAARTQVERATPGSPIKRGIRWFIFRQLFGNMRMFRRLSYLLSLYQRSGLQWLARKLGILRILRLYEMESLLPSLPAAFLVPSGQTYATADTARTSPGHEEAPTKVALFAGCIMSTAFAETDRATIRVLMKAGCTVTVPAQQGCCGALTIHAGDMDEARVMAKRNIDAFENSGAEYIIINAAGCGAALKEYAHLLHDDPVYTERAARFSAQVRDISEFLAQRSLPLPARPLNLKVTYQEACHLVHAQRISSAPRALLHAIPGLELREMQEPDVCCGSAGIYNVTQPEMSGRLQKRKIEHILATQADVVVTANPGCFMQLASGLQQAESHMHVMHIVDVLDLAYRET
jgi:glycolate oxidase iron-sulfur subunit